MTLSFIRVSSLGFLLVAIFTVGGWNSSFAQNYCRPTLGSCCEWISNVSVGSINHNTKNESGYADYTNISTVVTKGQTYPISIKVSTNSIYVEHVQIFFDWDRDFIFETALYLGSAKFTGSKIYTGQVTVPLTAKDGCSMMRVFMQYAQQPSGACVAVGDGEVEDYTLVVTNTSEPVANFTVPTSACATTPISFINTSSVFDNGVMSYLWDFGDGTNSTDINPSKSYAVAGDYTVKLTSATFCTSHSVTKKIKVNSFPSIIQQPINKAVCPGVNTFFAVSTDPGLTYKWQLDQGSGFNDISNNGIYSQATTPSLTITEATASMNGYQYRCLITGSCTITSSVALLTILESPAIVENPANALVCNGDTTSYSVTATGSGLTYQWQQNTGGGFLNLSNDITFNNVTTRVLAIIGVTTAFDNYQYRCIVTGACTAISAAASLKIIKSLTIVSHPINSSVLERSRTSFTVQASGAESRYQWQENKGSGFANLVDDALYANVLSATLTIKNVELDMSGYRYRCIVSGSCTSGLISDSAILTVKSLQPTITSTAVTSINEDLLYNYIITATDATENPLVYSAVVLPNWLSFNSSTHALMGSPTNEEVGKHPVILRVSNGVKHIDQVFEITVINTNDAPTFISAAPTIVKEDDTYYYNVAASDVDEGANLSYSVPIKPAWLFFDIDTHQFSGIPINKDVGTHDVTIQVSDGLVSIEQHFKITVTNTNDLPLITSIAMISVYEDDFYSYQFSISDVDSADVISFSSPVKPTWLTFDLMTGALTGSPSNSEVGSHSVTLRVDDGYATVDQSFVIVVKNVNDISVVTSTPVTVVEEDSPYGYTITAFDVDKDDKLNFAVSQKPVWLNFNAYSHFLYGTPTNDDVGSHTVTLTVTDGTTTVFQTFSIMVKNLNDAPTITSVPIKAIEEDSNYNYVLQATDMDLGDVLRYAAVTKPEWLTFNTNTGVLKGTPHRNETGVHQVILRVNDGSVEVDQSFTINVTKITVDPGVSNNRKPTQLALSATTFESSVSTNELLGIFTTTDEDDTEHVYELVNGNGDSENDMLRIEANKLYLFTDLSISDISQFSIRVRSTDPHSNSIEKSFVLDKLESRVRDIRIPTTFSPDGDGINDTWVVKDLKHFKDVLIEVFDRSGVPLYTSKDPEEGWDGSVRGGRILEGPFFYIIKIHDTSIIKKGVLIVIK